MASRPHPDPRTSRAAASAPRRNRLTSQGLPIAGKGTRRESRPALLLVRGGGREPTPVEHRRMGMARTHARWWVLIGLGVIAVVGLGPAGVAAHLRRSSGDDFERCRRPGANVAVTGAGFGTVATTRASGSPLGSPARHIEIAFVEGLDRRVLGFARADDDYSLTLWVTVYRRGSGAASLDVGGLDRIGLDRWRSGCFTDRHRRYNKARGLPSPW